jgi:putative FmdB family regulatory protein
LTYPQVSGTDYTGFDWRCPIPVYEYQCQDCGKKFEVVATLAEKEAGLDPACPKCGRMRARQIFSRFTLLTGSKTDEGLDDMGADDDLGGLPDEAGGDGLDDLGGGDSGDLDDFE